MSCGQQLSQESYISKRYWYSVSHTRGSSVGERRIVAPLVGGSIPSPENLDNLPEWLTGPPAKRLGFARTGSNPVVVVFALIAQLVERFTCNEKVHGSIPCEGIILINNMCYFSIHIITFVTIVIFVYYIRSIDIIFIGDISICLSVYSTTISPPFHVSSPFSIISSINSRTNNICSIS